MKLHEEFKEYENLWEAAEENTSDTSNPLIRTFGKKTYNLANRDELDAWFKANYEFQKKRYPERYADFDPENGFKQNSNRQNLRAIIANNLLTSLQAEGVTDPAVISYLTELSDINDWFGRLFRDGEVDRIISAMTTKLTNEEKQLVRPEIESIKQKLITFRKKNKKS